MRSRRRSGSHNLVTPAREVTVRRAGADDDAALARLAALDSARVPAGPVLLAEAGGTPVAAISLADGSVVADPFERTAEYVELLYVRAAHAHAAHERRSRLRLGAPADAAAAHSIANQT